MNRLSLVLTALTLACASAPPKPEASTSPEALVYETYTVGGEKPEGLLVALHYSGSTPAFWREYVESWGAPVRVLLPQGPIPRREGFTWFPLGHEEKDEAAKLADVEAMAVRIAKLIRDVKQEHPELRRVAVTGFSYGGDLAWLLAARYPELVHASAPMGTRLLGDPTGPLSGTSRVRVFQGEVDAIIDAKKTSARVEALKARGVPVDVRVYPGLGHDISPQLIEDWRAFLREELAR
jgi:phospholipase/carboxylesterase